MQDELITKLNMLISNIDSETIKQHVQSGTLDDWVYDWRIEAAAVSLALFAEFSSQTRR